MHIIVRVELLTVKVLEVGKLDALAHAENVGSCAEAVEGHPKVSSVQGGDGIGGSVSGLAVAGQSMLNISPSGNDGGENH